MAWGILVRVVCLGGEGTMHAGRRGVIFVLRTKPEKEPLVKTYSLSKNRAKRGGEKSHKEQRTPDQSECNLRTRRNRVLITKGGKGRATPDFIGGARYGMEGLFSQGGTKAGIGP